MLSPVKFGVTVIRVKLKPIKMEIYMLHKMRYRQTKFKMSTKRVNLNLNAVQLVRKMVKIANRN